MKKLFSILLTLVMLLVCVNVKADTATITINSKDTKDNAITYNAYKLFDAKYVNGTDGKIKTISYSVNSAWVSFFDSYNTTAGDRSTNTLIKFHDNGVNVIGIYGDNGSLITADNLTDNAGFTKFRDAVKTGTETISSVGSATKAGNATSTTITVNDSNGAAGYYFVDSTLGALVGISTAAQNVTINEKNTYSVPEKEVISTTPAKVGSLVTYQATFTIGSGAVNYVFEDTMSTGLTFEKNATVTVKNGTTTLTNGTEYTFNETHDAVNGDGSTVTFKVNFSNDYVKAHANETITITYSARINGDAAIINQVENECDVLVGDGNKIKSTPVKTDLYELTFKKVNDAGEDLTGAEFSLWGSLNGTDQIALVKVTDENGTYYRPATDEEKAATGFVSAPMVAGKVLIKGLASGTYYLQEDKEPVGYTRAASRFVVKTSDLLDATTNDITFVVEDDVKVITINNPTGNVLPSTGGIGTTLFVTIGSLMVLAFGAMLVTKARLAKEFN